MRGGVNVHLKEQLKDNSGFSLVEVIMALAILALVTLPIVNYFTYSSVRTIDGRERQTATMAAGDVMEELKAYSNHEQIAQLVATPDPLATATPAPATDTYVVRVYSKYSYDTALGTSVTKEQIKAALKRVLCVHVEKGTTVVGAPDSTTAPVATPTAAPSIDEKWEVDSSPVPEYLVAPGAAPAPLDMMRKVDINGNKYLAKVHVDYDTYDSDTKTVDGADITSEYNDYYIPQPSDVYAETNVIAQEDDEVDVAVSEILTDLTASSGALSGIIEKEVTIEETEIRTDKLENIFVFYKPAWDSSKTENFKVTVGAGITEAQIKKWSIYLTYQDVWAVGPGETPSPSAVPAPNASDIGSYTLKMVDTTDGRYAKFYSNLNRPTHENQSINTVGFTLQKTSAGKWDSYVSKNRKNRIGKIYVDIFKTTETDFSKKNAIAHAESSHAE